MKTTLLNICKAMAFATTIGAASVAWAQQVTGVFPASTDFESDTDYVVEDSSASNVSPRPESHGTFTVTPSKVLDLEEADNPIVKSFGTSLSGSVYFDALLKMAPATTTPEGSGATDKLLVYAKIFTEPTTTTNLCVWAKDAQGTTNEFVLTDSIAKDTWYRVVIAENNGQYQVFLNNNYPNTPCATAGGTSTFYALSDGASSEVALAGSGRVDDLVLSDVAPDKKLMTLSWDTEVFGNSVSYVVGGNTNTLTAAANIAVDADTTVTLVGNNGFRDVADTVTASGSSQTFVLNDLTGLAKYTEGDGTQANPYEIPTYGALVAMQQAVAGGTGNYRSAYYIQTADIALEAAWPGIGLQNGKDSYKTDAFNEAAFRGTYDGQNHTISNFQMEGGNLDYCGFFNSIYQATIQNLKISYKEGKFAEDTQYDDNKKTEESGATFVGVAKSSTLFNLTSLAGTDSISCSKGFGGIVGYMTLGTTVDSCTNNVNITSLKPNKAGGIAMITQQDQNQDSTATNILRNCQNNGTTTGSAEHGGFVGYVEAQLLIDGCESTVADQLLNHYSRVITVQGVNKANANSISYVKHSGQNPADFDGLNFATVDNGVATFVANNALVAGNTYKVMASGATATYAFAAPGTIAFDTALATPTYAITAAQGLTVTSATEGTVKTYTAAAASTIPDWATDVTGDSTAIDQAVSGKYATWADKVAGSGADLSEDRSAQFLMNIPANATDVVLKIESINVYPEGTQIVLGATYNDGGQPGVVDMARINGILNISVAQTLGVWAKKQVQGYSFNSDNQAVITIPASEGKFVKASVDYTKGPDTPEE